MSQLDRREEIFPIIFNQSNLVSGTTNTFTYTFPQGGIKIDENSKVALSSIQIYNSIFNISAALGNNTFSIIWPTGASTTTVNFTVPDGSYSISDLNAYIQFISIQNGFYLVDGNGNNVYYIELVENQPRYSIQENAISVPTSLPTGFSNPGSWSLPTTAYTPQLVVPSLTTSGFGILIGFNAGTYPSPHQTSNFSKLSDFTPDLNPVSSIVVLNSLVSNNYSIPSSVCASFSFGSTPFGSLLNYEPPVLSWCTSRHGNYQTITTRFVDQNFNPITLNDTNVLITFLISNSYSNVSTN